MKMVIPSNRSCHNRSRSGAIAPLLAVSLPALLILIGFAINLAYMELVRGQLRITCDSAAKAALVQYGSSQSQSTARTFASGVAANNLVANQVLSFASSNIAFGNSTKNGSGVYVFTSGGTPSNSVQVTRSVSAAMLFSAFLPVGTFSTTQTSTVTRISHDIVLVLDRSASMAFDQSSSEFVYPTDISSQGTMIQSYFTPPSQTNSRWAALSSAVASFVSTLQARNLDVHVSLVTFSEAYTFGNYSSTQATLDVPLTSDLTQTTSRMAYWNTQVLLGDTNIAAGLALAQTQLTGANARVVADRTVILLSDGVPTTGNTDIPTVVQGLNQNSQIVTHVITFGAEAASGNAQTVMQNAATSGNGMYFSAPDSTTLQTAFQTIADSLPAVYTN